LGSVAFKATCRALFAFVGTSIGSDGTSRAFVTFIGASSAVDREAAWVTGLATVLGGVEILTSVAVLSSSEGKESEKENESRGLLH